MKFDIQQARLEHVREIMTWFPDRKSLVNWGGPYVHYPIEESTFLEDIHWNGMPSRVACFENGRLLGFGQYYRKFERCHLARLVIDPDSRGEGLGQAFVSALMKRGTRDLDTRVFSLYVLTTNQPAYRAYLKLGFNVHEYPESDPRIENCVFMVADSPL